MTRAGTVQRPPEQSLQQFPSTRLTKGTRIHRAARREPWFFCACGECRFDLPEPKGTLYAGTDPLVGVLECIGPELAGGTIGSAFLAARTLWSYVVSSDLRLAHLTARRAAGFGVTNELTSMTPYEVPQAWAAAFEATNGFDGIRSRARFDPGGAARAIALFGPSGTRTWRSRNDGPCDRTEIIDRLRSECAITVADPPRLAQLDVR